MPFEELKPGADWHSQAWLDLSCKSNGLCHYRAQSEYLQETAYVKRPHLEGGWEGINPESKRLERYKLKLYQMHSERPKSKH